MMKTLEGEGITFDEIFIDRSMPEDMAPVSYTHLATGLHPVQGVLTVRRFFAYKDF